eukprot:gene10297-10456_t
MVLDNLQDTLHRVIGNALDPSAEAGSVHDLLDQEVLKQNQPELVLVVLGTQVQTSDLRSKGLHNALHPLKELMQSAQSSVSLPFVVHKAAEEEMEQLWQTAEDSLVVGCGGAGERQHTLSSALQEASGRTSVVVLCTKVPADVAGTPEGVKLELQQLQEAHSAAAALNKRQINVYAVRPDSRFLAQQRRRHLQALTADVGSCGPLCQTQVKWLEGILAGLVLVVAAFSGLCCLYMLDTPTRFEKPKEGLRND